MRLTVTDWSWHWALDDIKCIRSNFAVNGDCCNELTKLCGCFYIQTCYRNLFNVQSIIKIAYFFTLEVINHLRDPLSYWYKRARFLLKMWMNQFRCETTGSPIPRNPNPYGKMTPIGTGLNTKSSESNSKFRWLSKILKSYWPDNCFKLCWMIPVRYQTVWRQLAIWLM